jgi:hypothetical protein
LDRLKAEDGEKQKMGTGQMKGNRGQVPRRQKMGTGQMKGGRKGEVVEKGMVEKGTGQTSN